MHARSIETGAARAVPALLGTVGESVHARRPEKGVGTRDPAAGLAHRRRRFELLRTAQGLLFDRQAAPDRQHATCWCHRTVIGEGQAVGVHRAADGAAARLSGVITCGLVWSCPVCAAKIAEERRRELELGMANHAAAGGAAYLLTLTFPHGRDDELEQLLERQADALKRFKNSRTYKRTMAAAGRVGSVRSLEVTWGVNGWHPHTHDLIFAERHGFGEGEPDDKGRLSSPAIAELRAAWIHACQRAGLAFVDDEANMIERALDVRGGEHAADYVAKFGRDERNGMSRELTGAHAKVGGRGIFGTDHYTPFQLLEWAGKGDARAAALFTLYARCFKGRRMLTFTPGLRDRLGLGAELEDAELAARELPAEEKVGRLTFDQFGVLLSRNAVGEFLEMVARFGGDDGQAVIDDIVDDVRRRPPAGSSRARVAYVAAPYRFHHETLEGLPCQPS